MKNRKDIHDRVLNASNTQELMEAYREWADGYDQDLIHELAYVAPMEASKLLSRYLNEHESHLLDAGCGTGLVGECLQRLGYSRIDGLDYSESMLIKAREKRIYNNLFQADLTTTLDIDSNSYDAVICVGTFTCGHVGPEAINELIRITKPAGHICFTVRDQAWEDNDYTSAVKMLEQAGAWKPIEVIEADYIQQEGSKCTICLYQVT